MSRILPNDALQRITPQKRRAKAKTGETIQFVREVGNVYLFNKGKNGYILPADDSVIPLLGECDNGDFTLDLPPALEDWLADYDKEIDIQSRLDKDEIPIATDREAIPVLVKTRWAQGSPFNDRLVLDGTKCIVGCCAVAIGQVMYYWGTKGYHRGCTATQAYTTATNKYKVGALKNITVFDYKNLTQKSPTANSSIKAVSTLLEYISKSVKSNFGVTNTSSNATNMVTALKNNLRMGSKVRQKLCSTDSIGFEKAVYDELSKGCPVLMGGSHSKGGHMFVCDGYDAKNDKYHFNWGWGGSCDGYYAMTALNPKEGKSYNSGKVAIIGILPEYKLGDVNSDGNIDISDVASVASAVLNDRYTDRADVNSDGSVTIEDATLISNHILGKGKKL